MSASFQTKKVNGMYLKFPNGNGISTVWGYGTYSDNYDVEHTQEEIVELFDRKMDSNTVEIMFDCGDRLRKRILKKYNTGSNDPIGRLTITEWLEIVNLLAKEKK